MWRCSVCGAENQRRSCRTCGQLREDDYVANRTLCPVSPADIREALSRQQEYEARQREQERMEQLERALRRQDRKLKEMEKARRKRAGLGRALAVGIGLALLALSLGWGLRLVRESVAEQTRPPAQEAPAPAQTAGEDALAAAIARAEEEDFAGALEILREARQTEETRAEYDRIRALCEEGYVRQVLEDVDMRMADREREEALEVLREAMGLLPEEERLNQRRQELEAAGDISLTDLEPFEKEEWNWNLQDPIDAFGNDYSTACNYFVKNSFYETSWVEYRLDGAYQELTGLLAPHQSMKGDDRAEITVFADDVQVYSETVTKKTDLIPFSAEIAGADYIKIQVKVNNISGWSIGKLILAQVRLRA